MSFVVRCRSCGREFTPDHPAILAGPHVWRLCPACRNPQSPGALVGLPEAHPCHEQVEEV